MSTEAQLKGHSLTRQLEGTRQYAKEHNLELIDDLRDIGLSAYSGKNVAKGELGQFLLALEAGEIPHDCVLLVENMDRLSRKTPLEAMKLLSDIVSRGIEVHTILDGTVFTQESLNKNPAQLFLSVATMFRAHDESEQKSKRLKKRWKSNRDGMPSRNLTSICPAWLKANQNKQGFELCEERVKTIRAIYDMAIDQGMGAFAIASYLNAHPDKYPRFTKARKSNQTIDGKNKTGWQKSYVIRILNNPAVYGEAHPHQMVNGKRVPAGQPIPDYFPALISKERYLLAQARTKERRLAGGGRKGETFNNIFTKLIFCGECGAPVHYIDKGAPPKGGRYLRCSNSASSYKCKTKAWRYEEFEHSFLGFVSEVEFAAVLEKGTDKSKKQKLLELQQVWAQQHAEKKAGLKKFSKLMESMTESTFARFLEEAESLNQDLMVLEDRQRQAAIELEQIEQRSSHKVHDDVITAIRKAQEALTPDEQAAMRRVIHNQIRMVVERIELDGLTEADAEEDRCFTAIFKNGQERIVFPYSTDDTGIELREVVFNPETGRREVGETMVLDSTTFKFIGKVNLRAPANGKPKSKKKTKKQKTPV